MKFQSKYINKQVWYEQHSLLLTAGCNGTGRAASWLLFVALSSELTRLAVLQQLPVVQVVERQLQLLRRATLQQLPVRQMVERQLHLLQRATLQQLPVRQMVERQLHLLRRAALANPKGRPTSCCKLLQHAYSWC